ncbi:hypothetical protein [Sinorhizobium alkalisoli]|uniref:Uncharacterized protein n=1 Tax=Sinorhizobium alkalisoli TaxID=1752398 RepID=A0A1E3V7V3_9HYPH|nr:hypothetical protein [Sinorhizobium alkalisoli]MCA1489456.1 hypothetical protein [Ensifer sp. NBAIM29]MCG5480525.1 hypothetical protein [Sinorhizobium alkalisoli]ODR89713.1 hypothetical protein A8M32_16070 [Sinorhizobium alkalisoli]QFI65215.1 hypothetical protein EKH55_0341 [Sinorhizobium alkalisoli]
MKLLVACAMSGALLLSQAGPLFAEPLRTVGEVSDALGRCWTPPAGIKDSFVTLKFAFRADGSLMGPPQPTAVRVTGDEAQRKTFVAAATAALEGCMPLEFSQEVADEIAGVVFTLRFNSAE